MSSVGHLSSATFCDITRVQNLYVHKRWHVTDSHRPEANRSCVKSVCTKRTHASKTLHFSLSSVVYKHAGGVITHARYRPAMASLSLRRVTIDCSVEPVPNVLAYTPHVHNNIFHVKEGIHVGANGPVVDQTVAMRSGVNSRILHTVYRIRVQSAGSILSINKRSGPSGSGQFANVVSGSLLKPTGDIVNVCCKLLTTTICPKKQARIAKELSTLLYLGFGHPNICSAIDMKLHADCVVVVFPSLDITIEDMCNNLEGTLDARARFRVIFLLLNALRYLHKRLRLLHRDVAPRNVMLSGNCGVKLIDFGSAQRNPRDVPLFSSTTLSPVPPPPPAFSWKALDANPDTDGSDCLTFTGNKEDDDVCGALMVLKQISNIVVDTKQPRPELDLTFTSTDRFLQNRCVFYLHRDSTIPDSEELYQIMREKVQQDPTSIYDPCLSSNIRACLSKKACK